VAAPLPLNPSAQPGLTVPNAPAAPDGVRFPADARPLLQAYFVGVVDGDEPGPVRAAWGGLAIGHEALQLAAAFAEDAAGGAPLDAPAEDEAPGPAPAVVAAGPRPEPARPDGALPAWVGGAVALLLAPLLVFYHGRGEGTETRAVGPRREGPR